MFLASPALAAPTYLAGLGLTLSLIAAIGAQNAYVLRQGLRREHVALVVAVCVALDAALMALGISGLGAFLQSSPVLLRTVAWLGFFALAWYAWEALRRAWQTQALHAQAQGAAPSRRQALGQVLAISLLNPHVYLDTVLLVGALGAQQPAEVRGVFWLGAASASALWFLCLGFGARWLAPVFARPVAWRVLDVCVAAMMAYLAWGLLGQALA